MIFIKTLINGCHIIDTNTLEDDRGWFMRTYCKKEFYDNIGFEGEWVQMNHSFSKNKGTVRGLHYQIPPYAEEKLIRCIGGKVLDVVVDLRKGSNTFLKYISVELSDENKKMIYIPKGCAHGFQALTDNCQLIYHHSQFYNPNAEAGIRFNDTKINIEWPLSVTVISERDANHPYINESFKGI